MFVVRSLVGVGDFALEENTFDCSHSIYFPLFFADEFRRLTSFKFEVFVDSPAFFIGVAMPTFCIAFVRSLWCCFKICSTNILSAPNSIISLKWMAHGRRQASQRFEIVSVQSLYVRMAFCIRIFFLVFAHGDASQFFRHPAET